MNNPINILSTKILLSHQKQALLDANFNLIEIDFIKTENSDFDLKEVNENLIFSSQNAAQSVLLHPKCEELKSKNVFCVGIKTKAFLEENGFNVIVYVDYASDLAEIITLIYANESYTFFSGNLRKETLPKALKEAKIKFNEIQVYETTLTPQKVKTAVDGILFFSPSAIESYLKENKIKNELCFCIGETTASALETTTKNIIVADQPSVENVVEDVIEEFK
ncbi:uroporphyrinogen-III synthase [Flavobacterium cellulosilyticum]|uniref:Uroporphyrinogen-III synthase n=1 Tax=Flavobacterium cellulosilyticum TaxID=2541731 RepID=A0A4R5CIS0_9FLAO|nr:uroporphyrinogen-III synthase [Flavobacterium cellulosilyticum]TDD99695.1 uroporphyrinogen-III synthase [Flavobacterium cellulosilyticum]